MIDSQMGKPVKSVWDYTDVYDPKHQSCYFWLATTSWDQTSVMQGHLWSMSISLSISTQIILTS